MGWDFETFIESLKKVAVSLIILLSVSASGSADPQKSWTVVSIPDFLNVDLVMGHWDSKTGNDADTIKKYSERYYSSWINRMNDHNLKFYTALGDHDIGDDAWRDEKKFRAVSLYKKAFSDYFKMPRNGPEQMKGTAYWWRHNNVLFISVDVFEEGKSELGFIKIGAAAG
jgi:hypothetical protein